MNKHVCKNCGFNLVTDRKAPKSAGQTTFVVCPRCGHAYDSPITVGEKVEGAGTPPRAYTSIVEGGA